MSAVERAIAPPAPPHPAGVVDLARYRGRVGTGPPIAPPPRDEATPPAPAPPAPSVRPAPVEAPSGDGAVVIRRLRLGSVLWMAFGFAVCAFVVVIGAAVLLWLTISALGVVENVESLAEDLGWVDVSFDGPAMLRAASITGAILVVAATLLSVVAAEVFNLLSSLTGGLRAEVAPAPLTRAQRRRIRRALRRRERARARVNRRGRR